MRRPSHYRAPLQRSPGSRSNGNAQSPTAVAPAASLAQQEAPSDAVTTEMSVGRLTSEVVVREYSEEEDNSADEDNSPESDVPTAEKVPTMNYTEVLPPSSLKAEKIHQMHFTIRPYVPDAYKDDIIYAKPTPQQGDAAKATKQARRAHRATMAITAKENHERRRLEAAADDRNSKSYTKARTETGKTPACAKKRKANELESAVV
ncbi:hypothetical protein PC116_g23614 [Phytophthora cactorum]|uniref:Uncharacterized protein n=1 Tax=Phytophthora cactorum TaxID=29920 RepID=A0A8T1JUB3_9STRA|nr:hypothetical protein PC117_g21232 [Phytophthora cactorum]KAG4228023.1 hypothetical protein PC116_g23614 [Phytophthora cactorum]